MDHNQIVIRINNTEGGAIADTVRVMELIKTLSEAGWEIITEINSPGGTIGKFKPYTHN